MTPRVRYLLLLTVMAVGSLLAVCSLQVLLHIGSCGNGPNALAQGFGPCPGGIWWKILLGVAGLLAAIFAGAALGRPATSFGLGVGFTMLGAMFAILGFIPAPGEKATALGLAVGAPFLLGALIAFVFTVRVYRE
jgi:hypothetical protein